MNRPFIHQEVPVTIRALQAVGITAAAFLAGTFQATQDLLGGLTFHDRSTSCDHVHLHACPPGEPSAFAAQAMEEVF